MFYHLTFEAFYIVQRLSLKKFCFSHCTEVYKKKFIVLLETI